MADTQSILAVLLSISAGLLIWYILRLRQKRRRGDSQDLDDYSGMARNPEKLMDPDVEALEELELLVSNIDAENKIIFRANHGSNAYNIAGTFPDDKKEMLEKVGWLTKHPENVSCLLYTSYDADDTPCVDVGGGRII